MDEFVDQVKVVCRTCDRVWYFKAPRRTTRCPRCGTPPGKQRVSDWQKLGGRVPTMDLLSHRREYTLNKLLQDLEKKLRDNGWWLDGEPIELKDYYSGKPLVECLEELGDDELERRFMETQWPHGHLIPIEAIVPVFKYV